LFSFVSIAGAGVSADLVSSTPTTDRLVAVPKTPAMPAMRQVQVRALQALRNAFDPFVGADW